MTLKIEKDCVGRTITLRLSGWLRAEHLGELKAQMESDGARVVLDLADVGLVDATAVRFLGACESKGVEVLHCPPYIREWLSRETKRGAP